MEEIPQTLDLTGVNALAFGFGRNDEALALRRAAVGDAGVLVAEPLVEVVAVCAPLVVLDVLPCLDLFPRKGGIA